MPARFFITSGTTADCTVAEQLIEGFQAEYLLADRGYDTDAIVLKAAGEGMILLSRKKLGKAGEMWCTQFHGACLLHVGFFRKDTPLFCRYDKPDSAFWDFIYFTLVVAALV